MAIALPFIMQTMTTYEAGSMMFLAGGELIPARHLSTRRLIDKLRVMQQAGAQSRMTLALHIVLESRGPKAQAQFLSGR